MTESMVERSERLREEGEAFRCMYCGGVIEPERWSVDCDDCEIITPPEIAHELALLADFMSGIDGYNLRVNAESVKIQENETEDLIGNVVVPDRIAAFGSTYIDHIQLAERLREFGYKFQSPRHGGSRY